MKNHFGCPVQATSNIFSGKWKVLLLWHLAFRPQRFGELRRLLPGISQKVLTAQLRDLERDGVVARSIHAAAVPEVTYSLTQAGQDLLPAMDIMCAWATRYLGIQPNLPPRPVPAASAA